MSPDTERLLAATAVLVPYLAFCGLTAWRAARRRARAETEPVSGDGAPLLVAYASQTGVAEELARRTAALLRDAALPVRLADLGTLEPSALAAAERAVFLVSTTGEGDPPDGAGRFVRRVMSGTLPLPGLEYGLLALGDRSYARFCAFGRGLDSWLKAQGARPLFDRVEMDGGGEEALQRWQAHVAGLAGATALAAPGVLPSRAQAIPDGFSPWRLVERVVLNPQGLGPPVFRLGFAPLDGLPAWRAGDIAMVAVPSPQRLPVLPRREYSVASVPEDGRLELLVRQVRKDDGTFGLGSGWLTAQAPLGGEVLLRLRTNHAFHAPEGGRPMILIGNGTGIAGLRAHLKARIAAGERRNWLLFGERSRANDYLCREEIEVWQAGGHLARLDLAFSRDEPRRLYVQDRLSDAATVLRAWMAEGAAIHVCGSVQGMAPGVHAALAAILGAETLARLTEQGRYRRDVY